MSTFWKIFTGLALVLPLCAFFAGSLAVADQQPAPRDPIVIREDASPTDRGNTPDRQEQTPRRTGDDDHGRGGDDDGDDHGKNDDDSEDDHVITPQPDVRDDDDNSGHGGDDDDDNSGHDGGDDDSEGGDDD